MTVDTKVYGQTAWVEGLAYVGLPVLNLPGQWTLQVDSSGDLGVYLNGVEEYRFTTAGNLESPGGGNYIVGTNASYVSIYGGNLFTDGIVKQFNGISTAGLGTDATYAAALQTAVTNTGVTSFLSYTPPGTAGNYLVNVSATVTSATSGVVEFELSYHDAAGATVTTVPISLFQLGTASPALSFTTSAASRYGGSMLIDIDNSASAITIKWVGGGTLAGFASASIQQIQ